MSCNILGNRLTYCARQALLRASHRLIYVGRIVPELDEELAEKINDNSVQPKKLVTRRNIGMVFMPAQLQAIAEDSIRKYSDEQFRREAKYLIKVMSNMKLPDDRHSLKIKKSDIKTEFELRDKTIHDAYYDPSEFILAEDSQLAQDRLSNIILGKLDERRRDWHYFEYDQRASYMYMAARLSPNYSCIRTVMKEICDLDSSFAPKSVLDFGSGMGTTYWAVNDTWPDMVSEFMNVELSKEQQYLAESLLRAGKDLGQTPPGIFYRQYLPGSDKVKYDLVVAAFTLLELPTMESRACVIENLWHKTNDLLVIIERGNRGGFATVNEARHLILDLSGHDVTKKINLTTETRPVFKHKIPDCHILAPCAHEFACPRGNMTTKKNIDICRFRAFYMPLSFGEQKPGYMPEEFSYVVLRKKPHRTYLDRQCPLRWPRIVEERHKSNNQITHKLCCPNGTLSSATITKKKYGKPIYEVAKACNWGDILPIKVCDTYVVKNAKQIGDS